MTAALEGGEWSAARPQERPGTQFTGGWVGSRAGLDRRKISSPPGVDPGPPSPQLSRYTDWASRPTHTHTHTHTHIYIYIYSPIYSHIRGHLTIFAPSIPYKNWNNHRTRTATTCATVPAINNSSSYLQTSVKGVLCKNVYNLNLI